MSNSPNDNYEYNSASKDALIKQLKTHIKGMEQNEKTIEKLNKKFIELQNEFIHLSEEKTQIEFELKKELSIANKKVSQFQHACESMQQDLLGKNILNKKQLKDIKALENTINTKDDIITQLKAQTKKLKEDNNKYNNAINEYKAEQSKHQQQIEYLIEQNEQLTREINNNESQCQNAKGNQSTSRQQDNTIIYYEKQISESHYTIKKMNMIIKEFEGQIEDLQKEIEQFHHQQSQSENNKKNNNSHHHNDVELEEIIKQKDKHLKQNKNQIEILTDEKNKLIEDNTKMFNQIDEMQNHIIQLDEQIKKLKQRLRLTNYEGSYQKYNMNNSTNAKFKNNQMIKEAETFIDTNDYNENTIENDLTFNTQYDNIKTSEELSD